MFQETALYVRVKLTKADGTTKPDDNTVVSLKNYILSSLIEELQMQLNDFKVHEKYGNYFYRAYISDTFSMDTEAKQGNLVS